MGVPRLFPWIRENFRKSVKQFIEGTVNMSVDYTYIDGNAFIHPEAQVYFNYGEHKCIEDPFEDLSYEARETMTFDGFFRKIVQLCNITKPKKVLYIAMDGPAPLAKMNQQRQRRIGGVRETMIKNGGKYKASTFSPSYITPGTKFMKNLELYMNYAIRKELKDNIEWKDLKVIFSPPTVPGEGEHKIMDYMRALPEPEKKLRHCFAGPDADLIMLTLCSDIQKMFLLRPDTNAFKPANFFAVNIGEVRVNLASAMQQNKAIAARARTTRDVVNDFIVAGFFVGNDFVPRIRMFYHLEDALNFMIDKYATISKGGFENQLTVNGKFNIKGFTKFVELFAEYEEEKLASQAGIIPKDGNDLFINHTLNNCCSQAVSENNRVVWNINYPKYRLAYYAKMGLPVDDEELLDEQIMCMCHDYVKSLIWICDYYIHGLPCWTWAYKWHYAPLMKDLYAYLSDIRKNKGDLSKNNDLFTFPPDQACKPYEQLLSILPREMSSDLTYPFNKLVTDSDSPLVKAGYYPNPMDLRMDYEGVTAEHLGVLLLPFINYDLVHDAYTRLCGYIKNKGYNLDEYYPTDTVGQDYYFIRDDNTTIVEYVNKYGRLQQFKVVRHDLNF